jgi:formylglycine-generating enzyme required for sulfatase activity
MEINSILTLTDPFYCRNATHESEFKLEMQATLKSRDYFEAFCREYENAQQAGPNARLRSKDQEIFSRAKEILRFCYEDDPDPSFSRAIQRRACEIMSDVSDPGEWVGALVVYSVAWRLCNVLPDDVEDAGSAASLPDASEQSKTQELVRRTQDLGHQIDLLNSELELQHAVSGENNARIAGFQNQLEGFRGPLAHMKDIAVSGVTLSNYFKTGAAGIRCIEKISDAIFPLLDGAPDIALSPQAMDLVQRAATGSRDLVRVIAGAYSGNPDLFNCAQIFEERIEPYLVTGPTSPQKGAFRDIAEPWFPEMVEIPSGSFLMGSDDPAHQDEVPQHRVEIAYQYAVGRFPVTFEEYDAFCNATRREMPADNGWGRARRPVINVSWEDAQSYVDWLSGETGQVYRLLSEAEWEYACRAGSTASYSFGDDEKVLSEYGWFVGHLEGETRPVGERLPNDFGLFDMHGNVWEWIEDIWHDNYAASPPGDGSAWLENGSQQSHGLRGGSWVSVAKGLRSAVRFTGAADYKKNNVGFRVARTL